MHFAKTTLFTLALSTLLVPTLVGAIGVSPPWINQSKLVPGITYTQTIWVVRSGDAADLSVKAEFDVPEEIRDWFSIDAGTDFIIPAGTQQFPVEVTIDVPESADLAVYKGFLRISEVPDQNETSGTVTVATGVRVDINVTVGDDVLREFKVKGIDILDIREGQDPKIIYTIENTGNVPVAPERATLSLFDKYGEVRLGVAQEEELPQVAPFSEEKFTLEMPIGLHLGMGEYWAEATLYDNRKVIAETKTVFNVLEGLPLPVWAWWAIGGGVVLIILVLVLWWWLRRRKRPDDNNSGDHTGTGSAGHIPNPHGHDQHTIPSPHTHTETHHHIPAPPEPHTSNH